MTPTGPSIQAVPFWNIPWVWRAVKVSNWLSTLITKVSPSVASMVGGLWETFSNHGNRFRGKKSITYGHFPLTPTTWRSKRLSGFAVVYVMFQSRTTRAAWASPVEPATNRQVAKKRIFFWIKKKWIMERKTKKRRCFSSQLIDQRLHIKIVWVPMYFTFYLILGLFFLKFFLFVSTIR